MDKVGLGFSAEQYFELISCPLKWSPEDKWASGVDHARKLISIFGRKHADPQLFHLYNAARRFRVARRYFQTNWEIVRRIMEAYSSGKVRVLFGLPQIATATFVTLTAFLLYLGVGCYCFDYGRVVGLCAVLFGAVLVFVASLLLSGLRPSPWSLLTSAMSALIWGWRVDGDQERECLIAARRLGKSRKAGKGRSRTAPATSPLYPVSTRPILFQGSLSCFAQEGARAAQASLKTAIESLSAAGKSAHPVLSPLPTPNTATGDQGVVQLDNDTLSRVPGLGSLIWIAIDALQDPNPFVKNYVPPGQRQNVVPKLRHSAKLTLASDGKFSVHFIGNDNLRRPGPTQPPAALQPSHILAGDPGVRKFFVITVVNTGECVALGTDILPRIIPRQIAIDDLKSTIEKLSRALAPPPPPPPPPTPPFIHATTRAIDQAIFPFFSAPAVPAPSPPPSPTPNHTTTASTSASPQSPAARRTLKRKLRRTRSRQSKRQARWNRLANPTTRHSRRRSRRVLRKMQQRVRREEKKIRRIVDDVHHRVASQMCAMAGTLLIPHFATSEMVLRERLNADGTTRKRTIARSVARSMHSLAHGRFRDRVLLPMAAARGVRVVLTCEAYTSKTCSNCGAINSRLGSAAWFQCPICGFACDRDENGSRNIYNRHVSLCPDPEVAALAAALAAQH